MKIKNIRKKATTSLLILFVLLVGFRIYLPVLVLNYSNKVLSDLPEYEGSIDDIELCLWKGQYTIKGLEIYKLGGNELPLIVAPKTNLSIQWSALKELELVGEIDTYKPEVNFIIYDGKSKDQNSQTGTEVDWTKPIKDLMPLKINRFTVNEATLHYKDPAQKPAIDIFMSDLNITGTNFTNSIDLENPLPSKVTAECTSIGGGQMYMTMRINPLMQIPDLDYTFQFEGVDLTSLNDLSLAYAGLDFEKGTMNVYSELIVKDRAIEGYVKPVMNNIDFIDLSEDIKNPLKLVWEGFASVLVEVFENQGKDQFATKVPMRGKVDSVNAKIWPTLGAILKNAFVEAFKKQPDGTIEYETKS